MDVLTVLSDILLYVSCCFFRFRLGISATIYRTFYTDKGGPVSPNITQASKDLKQSWSWRMYLSRQIEGSPLHDVQ